MRPGGGKQKGAAFEREVCVLLSKWVTNGKREDVFWRSAMSGGRATVGHKRGKSHSAQVGDISCIHPVGHHFINHFAPECKHYADLNWTGLLTGKGKLIQFWEEISKQAAAHGKLPFLIARQNRFPTFVCINADGRIKLGLLSRHFTLHSIPHNMWIIESEKFFKKCAPYIKQQRIRIKLNAQRCL